jgi:hypothetical protein
MVPLTTSLELVSINFLSKLTERDFKVSDLEEIGTKINNKMVNGAIMDINPHYYNL